MKKTWISVIWLTCEGGPKDDIDWYDVSEEFSVTMLRVYNPDSGEHFITYGANEKDQLVSFAWKDEKTGYYGIHYSILSQYTDRSEVSH